MKMPQFIRGSQSTLQERSSSPISNPVRPIDVVRNKQRQMEYTRRRDELIKSYDENAVAALQGFNYYEGLGFAKGDIEYAGGGYDEGEDIYGTNPITGEKYVIGHTGSYSTSGKFYAEGTYSLYDPETGLITEYKANPQSNRREVNIFYNDKEYTQEELKNLNLSQEAEVVGEKFDVNKYLSNLNYNIIRDSNNNIVKIEAKPKEYESYYYKRSGKPAEKRVGTYIPEEIIINDGKVVKIINRDTYTTREKDKDKYYLEEQGVYDEDVVEYDEFGFIKKKQSFTNEWTDKDRDRQEIIKRSEGTYDTGTKTLEKSWGVKYGKDLYYSEEDYLKGVKIFESGKNKEKTNISKVVPLAENFKNIEREFEFKSGVDVKQGFATALEGEEIRKKMISEETGQGGQATTYAPAFNNPTLLGKKEALFGTQEVGNKVMNMMDYKSDQNTNPKIRGSNNINEFNAWLSKLKDSNVTTQRITDSTGTYLIQVTPVERSGFVATNNNNFNSSPSTRNIKNIPTVATQPFFGKGFGVNKATIIQSKAPNNTLLNTKSSNVESGFGNYSPPKNAFMESKTPKKSFGGFVKSLF